MGTRLYAIVNQEGGTGYLVRNLDDGNALLVFDNKIDAEIYMQLHCKGETFIIKEVAMKVRKPN